MTIASFKKYKNDKFKHKTDAEQAGISWVFDRLVDPTAELDHHVRDDENDVRGRSRGDLRMKLRTFN